MPISFVDRMPHIVCKDGAKLSVQADKNMYCLPRNNEGPYTHVEVGFPSVTPPETWREYADGEYPSDVYGYVPIELVEAYIIEHGGIDIGKTLIATHRVIKAR